MHHPLCHGSLLLEQPITAQLSLMDQPIADGEGGCRGQQREPLDLITFRGRPPDDRFRLLNKYCSGLCEQILH